MALSDIFGIDSTAGSDELKQAIAALQAVGVPSLAQLTLPELQKYVSAGVLSPQQYQAISADPQAYQNIASQADQSGNTAQKAALEQLGGIVQAGGSTPINQANLANNINQTNQAMQAARQGISENAQERGVSGGGLEFINKLMNEQSNAQNANLGAVNAGADNARLALQALTQQGQLGGQLQGQSNQMAQAQAEAARQIAEYNSQLQSQANQYNTQNANVAQAGNLANAQQLGNMNTENANTRTMYNAQLPQQQFQDQMQKAQGLAGAYGNMGNLRQQQAQNQNNFTGNLIGTGATVLGGIYGGPMGAAAGAQVGKQIGGQNGPPKSANTNQYAPYPDYNNYAHGGVVEENNTDHQMPMQAPTSGQAALDNVTQHAPSKIQEILHGLNSFVKNSPVKANIRPGHVGLSYTKRFAHGGEAGCYAQGGEVHDHELCMKAGGDVPGDDSGMPMGQDDESQDTIPAHLSPHEIVLPRSVAQAPDAPQQAAQFVGQVKGMPGQVNSFADTLKMLEENGLELRLCAKDGGY